MVPVVSGRGPGIREMSGRTPTVVMVFGSERKRVAIGRTLDHRSLMMTGAAGKHHRSRKSLKGKTEKIF